MLRRLILAAAFLASPAIARAADWDNFNGQFVGDVDLNAAYIVPDNATDSFGIGGGGNGVWRMGESNFHLQGSLHYNQSFASDTDTDTGLGVAELKGFWRWQESGLMGINAGYHHLDLGSVDADYFKAGLQAQLYGSDIVTFSFGAGAFLVRDDSPV